MLGFESIVRRGAPISLIVAGVACGGNLPAQSAGPGNQESETVGVEASLPSAPTGDANLLGINDPVLAPACYHPTSASDYFGLPRCCNTHAVVCEDFEGGSVGQEPNKALWSVQKDTASYTLEISKAQAARGGQSMHIQVPNANGERVVLVNTTLFPAPQNMFFGRAFIYFDTNTPNNHTTYVAAGPSPNSNYHWIRYSTFGGASLGGNDSVTDNSATSPTALPMGRWACLEWQINATDPSDVNSRVANYWLDGVSVTSLTYPAADAGTLGQVFIGWELYSHDGSQATWDMYFDEIALGYARIGCSN